MDLDDCTTLILSFTIIGLVTGYAVRAFLFPELAPINNDIEIQANILPSAPPLRSSA